jgi:KaiC/GvpD/RAD55 family RecA-like ATPase
MCDNIIILSTAARRVSIVKARATAHDLRSHELEINNRGLQIRAGTDVASGTAAFAR